MPRPKSPGLEALKSTIQGAVQKGADMARAGSFRAGHTGSGGGGQRVGSGSKDLTKSVSLGTIGSPRLERQKSGGSGVSGNTNSMASSRSAGGMQGLVLVISFSH